MVFLMHTCEDTAYGMKLLLGLALRLRSGWSAMDKAYKTGLEMSVDQNAVLTLGLSPGCTMPVVSLALRLKSGCSEAHSIFKCGSANYHLGVLSPYRDLNSGRWKWHAWHHKVTGCEELPPCPIWQGRGAFTKALPWCGPRYVHSLQSALWICHGDWAVEHVLDSCAIDVHIDLSICAIDDALRMASIT